MNPNKYIGTEKIPENKRVDNVPNVWAGRGQQFTLKVHSVGADSKIHSLTHPAWLGLKGTPKTAHEGKSNPDGRVQSLNARSSLLDEKELLPKPMRLLS